MNVAIKKVLDRKSIWDSDDFMGSAFYWYISDDLTNNEENETVENIKDQDHKKFGLIFE